jgi:hypothetical protein
MWKTVLVPAAVTVALTAAIGAGAIRATLDSGSAAPPAGEIAAADTVKTTDSSVQPAFSDTATNAGAAARAAVEVDMQADETPAPPPDPTTPESEDAWWGHMEGMHGADHVEWMRQHMGGGMMGGDGGGMMGGDSGSGMSGGGSGSGMMGW